MTQTPFSALTVFLALKGISWWCFYTAFTLSALYRIQVAGLDPLQLVLVGTALEAAIFFFEIPTGVVADTRGRKISMIFGFSIIGLGFALEGFFPRFDIILLAQVVWGFGFTLVSGAEDAWLADEIGEENLSHAYLRGTQVQQMASFLGIFTSVAVARGGLHLPFLVSGLGLVGLAFFLSLVQPEHGFQPVPRTERSTWSSFRDTLHEGFGTIQRRPLLMLTLGIFLCYGLSSEGLDRLWENHLLDHFTFPNILETTTWFGVLNATAMLLTLGLTEILRRRLEDLPPLRLAGFLLWVDGLRILALLVFAYAGEFLLAILAHILGSVLRQSSHPLFMAWVNRGLDSRVRATVLSSLNQMDALGQVVGGPGVGALANRFGLRPAIASLALLLLPVLPLFARARGILKNEKSANGT